MTHKSEQQRTEQQPQPPPAGAVFETAGGQPQQRNGQQGGGTPSYPLTTEAAAEMARSFLNGYHETGHKSLVEAIMEAEKTGRSSPVRLTKEEAAVLLDVLERRAPKLAAAAKGVKYEEGMINSIKAYAKSDASVIETGMICVAVMVGAYFVLRMAHDKGWIEIPLFDIADDFREKMVEGKRTK